MGELGKISLASTLNKTGSHQQIDGVHLHNPVSNRTILKMETSWQNQLGLVLDFLMNLLV